MSGGIVFDLWGMAVLAGLSLVLFGLAWLLNRRP